MIFMGNKTLMLGLIIIPILFTSCDGEAGLEGVVIDKRTGERLENVYVIMSSSYKTIETKTDLNGYFFAIDFYSCGGPGKKCDDSFTILFEKEGYEYLQLNENYQSDSSTIYLNDNKKDTVYIKMVPIEGYH